MRLLVGVEMNIYKKNTQNRVFAPTRAWREQYIQRIENKTIKWLKGVKEIGIELYAKKYCRKTPFYLPKAKR